MSFEATVLPIMIASPGDVLTEAQVAAEVIQRWNDINAATRQVVLLPVNWRTHSTPEFGEAPQEVLNRQVLKNADILIGIFWTRLGTQTATHLSGTVEEIDRHHSAGKVTKIYFSSAPASLKAVDMEQYGKLKQFRELCASKGLVAEYASKEEFREIFSRHLDLELNNARYLERMIKREHAEKIFNELNREEMHFIELAYLRGMLTLVPNCTGAPEHMPYSIDLSNDDDVAMWERVAMGLETKGILTSIRRGYYCLSRFGQDLGPLSVGPMAPSKVYRRASSDDDFDPA